MNNISWESANLKFLLAITVVAIIFFNSVHGQNYNAETLQTLASKFQNPGIEYGPHVWWHWMGPNFSKEGITKDLEAMKEAGIGGATIFNITSSVQESHYPIGNNPWPEQTYRSAAYWEAMQHTMKEAKRLGLKIGLHGTPGYSLTGGPWIDEERGMKALISSKIEIKGGMGETDMILPLPELPEFTGYDSKYTVDYKPWKASKYWDVAVIAVPDKEDITVEDIVDLSGLMDTLGHLRWNAPEGEWTLYRYVCAPTMGHPHPLPDDIIGKALEVDKMSREDNVYYWENLLNPLKEHIGEYFGNTFSYIWVDSYEAGYQNWTGTFREEFIRLKGYDPIPWIALYQFKTKKQLEYRFSVFRNSRLSTDMPEFQTFIKDYDNVVNRLYIDNGWQTAKEMLHNNGLDFYWEPYGGPFSTYEGAMIADIPVGEFWSSETMVNSNPYILRAAADFSKRIVAAEALTGSPIFSRYIEDPASLKHTVNGGYACGYNLYFLHHWVHQPFDDKYQPGMGMGWWGSHFGRFQTWYEPGKAFFTYMARCQMMLQQGSYVPTGSYMAHRRTPEADIFFVTNMTDTTQEIYSFPVTTGSPELWDPYKGTITASSHWEQRNDSIHVTLNLAKDGAMIVVFPHIARSYNTLSEFKVVKETRDIVSGNWDVDFQPKLDKPFRRKLRNLIDWSKQKDTRLKYFSGTAKYNKDITVHPEDIAPNRRIVIDLGELHDIAEMEINGKTVGVLWSEPYNVDVTEYLRPGRNTLSIYVTNNWANRLIGDEQYPADFEYAPSRGEEGRAMKAFPEWFLKGESRPVKERKTFSLWHYFQADSPLYPAGLLGPVQIIKQEIEL